MKTYLIEGMPIDLTRVQCDVTGVNWEWTGTYTDKGVPLMQSLDGRMPVSLLDVYWLHGPLIPVTTTLPDWLLVRALEAPTPADVLRGAA